MAKLMTTVTNDFEWHPVTAHANTDVEVVIVGRGKDGLRLVTRVTVVWRHDMAKPEVGIVVGEGVSFGAATEGGAPIALVPQPTEPPTD